MDIHTQGVAVHVLETHGSNDVIVNMRCSLLSHLSLVSSR
jgi:hypothetical protein